MSILKVARMGHPVLRAKARPVDKAEFKSPVFQALVDAMVDTMFEYSGVGLAAPQVHESVRMFVAMLEPDGQGEGDAGVFINPEITLLGDERAEGWNEWFESMGVELADTSNGLDFSDREMALRAAEAGQGVALCTKQFVGGSSALGQVSSCELNTGYFWKAQSTESELSNKITREVWQWLAEATNGE